MPQTKGCLTVVAHPLVQHKLSLMRDRTTSTAEFRRPAARDQPSLGL
jgi:uracil phosphoribosyltransferase